jgi:hypothetical protein
MTPSKTSSEKTKIYSYIITLQCYRSGFNSSLFDEFVCKLGLFWHAWAILKRE